MKTFYQSYVRQALGDRYRLAYLNKLLHPNNYFSLYQFTQNKHKQQILQERIGTAITLSINQDEAFIVNSDLIGILLSNYSSHLIDSLSYSKIYLEVITYTNNLH